MLRFDPIKSMKAAVLTGVRKIEISDIPCPQIENDTDVLLKTARVGICGSDTHYFLSSRVGGQNIAYPAILGHECSAVVETAGVQVTSLKPGDRVTVDPAVSCGDCDQCRAGRTHTCLNLRFLGYPGQMEGCFAEYFVMPEKNCYALPDRLTMTEGALIEPLSVGLYAIAHLEALTGQAVAILGSGPIGLSLAHLARAVRIEKIFMTDKVNERLAAARQIGATWAGNPEKGDIVREILKLEPAGLDAVFECCGDQSALDQAVELLKPGGQLLIIGIPLQERVSFDISGLRRKEILVRNIRRQNRCTEKAVCLLAGGHLDIRFLATHRFRIEEAQEAFEIASAYKDGVLKALVSFE